MIRFILGCVLLCVATGMMSGAAAPVAPAQPVARISSYRLQPMDLIRVQFFQETDLDRELRVSQDFKIVLALVGPVEVRDRTVREVELLIAELYRKDYLVNPQVNVTIMEYSQRAVTVLGAVTSPGTIVIPPERTLTLLDVIARCGGFSRLANLKTVSLTRNLPGGRTVNYTVNAELMMSGDKDNQWTVKDGDIISVAERLL
jgi:polysaccharide export outer membrane protein